MYAVIADHTLDLGGIRPVQHLPWSVRGAEVLVIALGAKEWPHALATRGPCLDEGDSIIWVRRLSENSAATLLLIL